MKTVAIILAGGNSSRMKFLKNKIFMEMCGKPIISHLIDNLHKADINNIVVVSNKQNYNNLHSMHPECLYAMQEKPNGTGGALMACKELLCQYDKALIINGDGPIICPQLLQKLVKKSNADLTILTHIVDMHSTNGRVLRDNKKIVGLIEFKDANKTQKLIKEGNAGVYVFNVKKLLKNIDKLTAANVQNELYITDYVKIFAQQGYNVKSLQMPQENNYFSVNTMHEFNVQNKKMQSDIKNKLIENGVFFIYPDSVYVDCDVKIGYGSLIFVGVQMFGKTVVGDGCVIGANSVLCDCILSPYTMLEAGTILKHKKL